MTIPPQIKVLFFDVFGTCVAQRGPVADELWTAAQEALQSEDSPMTSEVRQKATDMTYEQWFELGGEWNAEESKFVREHIARFDTVDWKAVDQNRINSLPKLLVRRGLVIPRTDVDDSRVRADEGSLFDESQLEHLGRVWHRLTPWADTCRGLSLLNRKYSTVTLSNTYNELIGELVAHSSIPFMHTYSADMFQSYKPNSKVYLGAAEMMGVQPEECALVAAHLDDLKGAKACGFFAIYIDRPLEEKTPELRKENIPDMRIEQDEDGLVALAQRLEIDIH